jgi:hypothetical protein
MLQNMYPSRNNVLQSDNFLLFLQSTLGFVRGRPSPQQGGQPPSDVPPAVRAAKPKLHEGASAPSPLGRNAVGSGDSSGSSAGSPAAAGRTEKAEVRNKLDFAMNSNY